MVAANPTLSTCAKDGAPGELWWVETQIPFGNDNQKSKGNGKGNGKGKGKGNGNGRSSGFAEG